MRNRLQHFPFSLSLFSIWEFISMYIAKHSIRFIPNNVRQTLSSSKRMPVSHLFEFKIAPLPKNVSQHFNCMFFTFLLSPCKSPFLWKNPCDYEGLPKKVRSKHHIILRLKNEIVLWLFIQTHAIRVYKQSYVFDAKVEAIYAENWSGIKREKSWLHWPSCTCICMLWILLRVFLVAVYIEVWL